jgi:hypothetical protein
MTALNRLNRHNMFYNEITLNYEVFFPRDYSAVECWEGCPPDV